MASKSIRPVKSLYLVPKNVRTIIFKSSYWREECGGLTMKTLPIKAEKVDHCGGIIGEEPTPFICLLLKMLMIDPKFEEASDLTFSTPHRYLRAVGALFLRLKGDDLNVYRALESFFQDGTQLMLKTETGAFIWSQMDLFVEELLLKDNWCSIPLPRLKKRWIFEALGFLGPRSRYPDQVEEEIAKMAESDIAGGNDKESHMHHESQSACIAIGIKTKEGIIIAAEKMVTSPLLERLCVGKIMLIDEHVGCVMSGSIASARIVFQCLQFYSQHHRYTHGELVSIEPIAEEFALMALDIVDEVDKASMPGPFDVSLLIAGVDEDGPSLFYADSSGVYQACNAKAIGADSEDATRSLQEQFKEDITLTEAEKMAVSILKQFMKEEVTPNNITIAKVSPIYHLYSSSEVEDLLTS